MYSTFVWLLAVSASLFKMLNVQNYWDFMEFTFTDTDSDTLQFPFKGLLIKRTCVYLYSWNTRLYTKRLLKHNVFAASICLCE